MGTRLLLGEPLEELAGACCAVDAGDRIFVSGLTSEGGGAVSQFEAIVSKVSSALSQLESSLEDIVRTRVFFVGPADYESIGLAHGQGFSSVRPAMSITQVSFLPGDARVMMEVEAVRGAASARRVFAFNMPNAASWGYSGVVQVGDDLWVSGVTTVQSDGGVAAPGDMETQTRAISARIIHMLTSCGAKVADIVSTRHYIPVAYLGRNAAPRIASIMHPHHPTSAGITVQGLGRPQAGALVEVEAVIGASEQRRNLNTGRPYEEEHHYSRSVRVGDMVYVSGTTSVQLNEDVGAPFDAYGQTVKALEWVRWGIEKQGLSFSDLVRTRSYIVGVNNLELVSRALRETLGDLRPSCTVIGVPALGRPSILVEIEATAVVGASSGE